MTKTEAKYWYGELDRFGLLFCGMFLGALLELTGIRTLGIIVSVAFITTTIILMIFLERKFKLK